MWFPDLFNRQGRKRQAKSQDVLDAACASKDTRHAVRFEKWLQDHGAAVRGFLVASLHHRDLAEDLLQDVFCRAWEARARFQEGHGDRAFLLTIADRLVIDHYRRTRHETALDLDGGTHSPVSREAEPVERLLKNEAEQQVADALETLSAPQRRVLLLRYYGDLPFAEIANTTGWPLGTVLSHARRGLLMLRSQFAGEVV